MDGSKLKIGIAVSRWNEAITSLLLQSCRQALLDSGLDEDNIMEQKVPGSYELVFAAKYLIEAKAVDAVVAIGCLIKGETPHFEYLAGAVSKGIMDLNIQCRKPVIFGVLTCLNEEQARTRSSGENNHGYDWGKSAVEMALLVGDC